MRLSHIYRTAAFFADKPSKDCVTGEYCSQETHKSWHQTVLRENTHLHREYTGNKPKPSCTAVTSWNMNRHEIRNIKDGIWYETSKQTTNKIV